MNTIEWMDYKLDELKLGWIGRIQRTVIREKEETGGAGTHITRLGENVVQGAGQSGITGASRAYTGLCMSCGARIE